MGYLRTIFAISVVFAHSWPGGKMFVGGNAVQLFYIISGFLISWVLLDSKSYPKLSDFYINRYLRLYPIYFVVSVLTLILDHNQQLFNTYKQAPIAANVLLVFSNLFLFGQDWVMFLGVENNQLVFTPDFYKSEIVLYRGLISPQSWTLGVELSFYLLAPFVLSHKKAIYSLLAVSIGIRIFLFFIGIGDKDPWSYRFFPTELGFFLAGALAHQWLYPLLQKQHFILNEAVYSKAATYFLILFSIFYGFIPIDEIYKKTFMLATFILFIPLTFVFQNHHGLDKWIGNLSYPIYIVHLLVLHITGHIFRNKLGINNEYTLSIACVIFSILLAILLDITIGQPIEKIRKRLKKVSRMQ